MEGESDVESLPIKGDEDLDGEFVGRRRRTRSFADQELIELVEDCKQRAQVLFAETGDAWLFEDSAADQVEWPAMRLESQPRATGQTTSLVNPTWEVADSVCYLIGVEH